MPRSTVLTVVVFLVLTLHAVADPPRFTEPREAAALFFVRKHCPELMPLLDDLRKKQRPQYEQQIRQIFEVTEILAELTDARRHDLELKIWKTENRAFVLVGKLASASATDRKRIESQVMQLARELVELDVQVLEMQASELDRELADVRDELRIARELFEQRVRERQESLLEQGRKPKK